MKKTIFTLICFSQIVLSSVFANQYHWPKSETKHYEVAHDPWAKVLIPLPDFKYTGNPEDSSSIYTHTLYSHRNLFLTIDVFPKKQHLDVKTYAKWFTQTWKKEDPLTKLIDQKEIIAGSNNSTPMLLKTFKNSEGTIYQLYFVKDNHGFCFLGFCYPPKDIDKSIVDAENEYWQSLMKELAQAVQFYE
ncbi:MAG: hypothetical protein KR126chlam5_00070 [Candidatus Anoxychlamydiales bacterium]|nr:hypothetical protein [Candidatus Anoxychlamydiales bacterium]